MTRAQYERYKAACREAGERAKGKPKGSPEQLAYARARAEYHAAGQQLRGRK
jgi:hypothetical protein